MDKEGGERPLGAPRVPLRTATGSEFWGLGDACAAWRLHRRVLEGALARRACHSEADVGVGRLAGEEAGRVWGDR